MHWPCWTNHNRTNPRKFERLDQFVWTEAPFQPLGSPVPLSYNIAGGHDIEASVGKNLMYFFASRLVRESYLLSS